jgi:hypothetical protein
MTEFTRAHASTDESGSMVIARFRYEGRVYEVYCLLGCDAVRLGRNVPCSLILCSANVFENCLPDYTAACQETVIVIFTAVRTSHLRYVTVNLR